MAKYLEAEAMVLSLHVEGRVVGMDCADGLVEWVRITPNADFEGQCCACTGYKLSESDIEVW